MATIVKFCRHLPQLKTASFLQTAKSFQTTNIKRQAVHLDARTKQIFHDTYTVQNVNDCETGETCDVSNLVKACK